MQMKSTKHSMNMVSTFGLLFILNRYMLIFHDHFFFFFNEIGFNTNEVYSHVMDGYRMASPPNCPKFIYDLMLSCWSIKPDDRPSFSDLTPALENINRYELT